MIRRCAVVTGAGGLVGGAIARALAQAGWQVRGTARDPATAARRSQVDLTWFGGDLDGNGFDPQALDGAEVLVHAAWASDATAPAQAAQRNVRGAERLFGQARDHGVVSRVFVSSMSAHAGALSHYGRSKVQVEALLDPARDLVVRPGFVLGEGGVFQRLASTLAVAPAVPSFYGGSAQLQPIGLQDLANGFERSISRGLRGTLTIAQPQAVPVVQFYREVAASIGRARLPVVPLPGDAAVMVLGWCERIGLRLPMTSDNLLGQKALVVADVTGDLARLQMTPMDYRIVLRDLATRATTPPWNRRTDKESP